MIELAVAAYNRLGWPLKIVGDGPDEKRFRRLAGPERPSSSVRLRPTISAVSTKRRAPLIMPGEEDFGIAAVEAQACGTPVVAYGRGGALETVLDGKTGVLFGEPDLAEPARPPLTNSGPWNLINRSSEPTRWASRGTSLKTR